MIERYVVFLIQIKTTLNPRLKLKSSNRMYPDSEMYPGTENCHLKKTSTFNSNSKLNRIYDTSDIFFLLRIF